MQIGVAVKSTSALTSTWTTCALIAAARRQGHAVWVFEGGDLAVAHGTASARASHLAPDQDAGDDEVARTLRSRTAPRRSVRLDELDLLFLRSAPLDPSLLAFALHAESHGVEVVNRPLGVLQLAHKSWLASLDVPTPTTLVTRSRGAAHEFHQTRGPVVVKPNRGSGGVGVSRVAVGDPAGMDDAFSAARRAGDGLVVVQDYVVSSGGEKRLVWCDGEVIGGYVRQPAVGDFRHNLRQGATPHRTALDPADHAIGAALAPHLRASGIRLAGLDVLGGLVVEVNAVNPGGTVHADALHGTHLADRVVRSLTGSGAPVAVGSG